MKKLMIAAGLLMVAGSAAADSWQDGNSAPVSVTFQSPDTVTFSRESKWSFNKDTALLASTPLGSVTASKAGNYGDGIRFHWSQPYNDKGKGDITDFVNNDGPGTIAVKLKDDEAGDLLSDEADSGLGWYKVNGKASASEVTVQFYPAKDISTGLTAGRYTAGIQAAVYSN